MSLDQNPDVVFSALKAIRKEVQYGRNRTVFIEMEHLKEITPEVALLLLAEMDYCRQIVRDKNINGDRPSNQLCSSILGEIGYYEFFGWSKPEPDPERHYLKAARGNSTIGESADKLIRVFEHQIVLERHTRSRLYEALVECMQNVRHHAYGGRLRNSPCSGQWWMMGFSATKTREISVCFVDMGLGIPTTLRQRLSDKIKNAFVSENDLIQQAVTEGRSRTHDPRRGYGLPSLRSLVDLVPAGRFRICSNTGNVIYARNSKPVCYKSAVDFQGTVISWVLKTSG